jgi:hypothetical protein
MDDRTARLTRICAALLVLSIAGCEDASSIARGPASGTTSPTPIPSSSPTGEVVDPIDGCVPACVAGITEPGDLPVGTYETEWFFGGEMQLTFDEAWTSGEDSTGEFAIAPAAAPENGVFFWQDVYPVEDGKRVHVPMTAAAFLDWLRSNDRVRAGEPVTGAIGELPATVVDVSVAPDAENEEVGNPYCERRTCILFLGFPRWDGEWGIAGGQVQRFYLADVKYGGKQHLFVAVVYPDDEADMGTFEAVANPVLETVVVPAMAA